MKHRVRGFLLFLAAVVWAAVPMKAAEGGLVEQLQSQWEASRRQMVRIAEAMPGNKVDYRPTPEVRSFAEIVVHLAGENMNWMETVEGAPKAGTDNRFEHLTTRPEILKALSDYYDYGAKVLADLTDQQAMESVPYFRGELPPRWVIVVDAIGHSKEHYGNLVTYLRLNSIVPPSSPAGQQQ